MMYRKFEEVFPSAIREVLFFCEEEQLRTDAENKGIDYASVVLPDEQVELLHDEFKEFYEDHSCLIHAFMEEENVEHDRFIHLYYYTRNGHGVGFHDYKGDEADILHGLTEWAPVNAILGEDGKIDLLITDVNTRVKSKLFEQMKDECRGFYRKDGNGAGGSLHLVLDDGNVSDDNVKFCIDYAEKKGDTEGAALGRKLLELSIVDRYLLYMGLWGL